MSDKNQSLGVAQSAVTNVSLTELADALIGIQEDMPSADVRDALGMAAHYLRKFAAQPPAAPVETEEVGWIIEKDDPPVYHLISSDYDEHWTSDVNKALRFARKEDANAYVDHVGWTSPPVRTAEHMWIAPRVVRVGSPCRSSAETSDARPRAPDLADWSSLPRDLYVVSVKSSDKIVYDVHCCSVPMAIGPEVRYSAVQDTKSRDYERGYAGGWYDMMAKAADVAAAMGHEDVDLKIRSIDRPSIELEIQPRGGMTFDWQEQSLIYQRRLRALMRLINKKGYAVASDGTGMPYRLETSASRSPQEPSHLSGEPQRGQEQRQAAGVDLSKYELVYAREEDDGIAYATYRLIGHKPALATDDQIKQTVDSLVKTNGSRVERVREHEPSIGWFVGQTMNAFAGRADPERVLACCKEAIFSPSLSRPHGGRE